MTKLFDRYIGQRPGASRCIYAILNAYAHGMQWKNLLSKIEGVDGAAPVPGGRLVKTSANGDATVMMTSVAVLGCALAVEQLGHYHGRGPRRRRR
jgi:hypothetical protein